MKQELSASPRQTRYALAIEDALSELKHATNLELLSYVRLAYPEVSATTIHRVTARLKERGIIGCAPKSLNGSERYDINPIPHHHFICEKCSRVCDFPETAEASEVLKRLKKLTNECAIAGTLAMQGVCKRCVNEEA